MPTLPGAKALRFTLLFVLLIVAARAGFAQWVAGRYALVLEDAPVAARYAPAASLHAGEPLAYRNRIEDRQRALRTQLASRGIQVTGTATTLVNAVFVSMPESRVAEARSLEGVAGVVPLRRYKKLLNRAAELVSASPAWARLGGQANGGAGVKIAVLAPASTTPTRRSRIRLCPSRPATPSARAPTATLQTTRSSPHAVTPGIWPRGPTPATRQPTHGLTISRRAIARATAPRWRRPRPASPPPVW
jgi:hypothetical protein